MASHPITLLGNSLMDVFAKQPVETKTKNWGDGITLNPVRRVLVELNVHGRDVLPARLRARTPRALSLLRTLQREPSLSFLFCLKQAFNNFSCSFATIFTLFTGQWGSCMSACRVGTDPPRGAPWTGGPAVTPAPPSCGWVLPLYGGWSPFQRGCPHR